MGDHRLAEVPRDLQISKWDAKRWSGPWGSGRLPSSTALGSSCPFTSAPWTLHFICTSGCWLLHFHWCKELEGLERRQQWCSFWKSCARSNKTARPKCAQTVPLRGSEWSVCRTGLCKVRASHHLSANMFSCISTVGCLSLCQGSKESPELWTQSI